MKLMATRNIERFFPHQQKHHFYCIFIVLLVLFCWIKVCNSNWWESNERMWFLFVDRFLHMKKSSYFHNVFCFVYCQKNCFCKNVIWKYYTFLVSLLDKYSIFFPKQKHISKSKKGKNLKKKKKRRRNGRLRFDWMEKRTKKKELYGKNPQESINYSSSFLFYSFYYTKSDTILQWIK